MGNGRLRGSQFLGREEGWWKRARHLVYGRELGYLRADVILDFWVVKDRAGNVTLKFSL